MPGVEVELTDVQWNLLSIGCTMEHCRTFKIWCDTFPPENFGTDDMIRMKDSYDQLAESAILFSLLSVRKLEDLFRDAAQQDDLNYATFGIDRDFVLEGGTQLLTADERIIVNKSIAHLTERGALDFDGQEDAVATLERIYPALDRLEAELKRLGEASQNPTS